MNVYKNKPRHISIYYEGTQDNQLFEIFLFDNGWIALSSSTYKNDDGITKVLLLKSSDWFRTEVKKENI